MTFYQELQLNQAGSKNLLKKSETLKQKLYHMWVYLVKIAATMAFCFFFVSIFRDVYKRQPPKFTNPAFAPEREIVITGATVWAALWYVEGTSPPATTGISPGIASLERRAVPR